MHRAHRGGFDMKAKQADQFSAAPTVADIADEPPAHAHGESGEDGGHHHGAMESTRCATHCGYEIVIKTCYEITVGGKPLSAHLMVNDDGSLNTHALPEYSFSSAVDVVKKIIEAFPDEFPCDEHDHEHGHEQGGGNSPSGEQGHSHGGHTHEHP